MKIATWNINSVRLRIDLLKKLMDEHSPDIIMLQETKVDNPLFPLEECKTIGYEHIHFDGGKSYNGVAILSKIPFDDKFILPFCKDDKRHTGVRIKDIEIHNFYVPSGGDIPDTELNDKFKHKLEYLEEMRIWFNKNRKTSDKILLAGDLNIAPLEHDVWSSKQLRNEVSHTDIERKMMMQMIEEFGWNDIARKFVPANEKLYSWWSYRNRDWEKSNRGRRLDHIWLSNGLKDSCSKFHIVREARNWERTSDHVPVIVDIA